MHICARMITDLHQLMTQASCEVCGRSPVQLLLLRLFYDYYVIAIVIVITTTIVIIIVTTITSLHIPTK